MGYRQDVDPAPRPPAHRTGPVTLGWLAEREIGLLACCDPCGRSVEIPLGPMLKGFGKGAELPSLRGALVCGRCGRRRTDLRPNYVHRKAGPCSG